MPRGDHRAAIHATPTSAIWAVAGLLAVALLLVAAVVVIDALSAPSTSATAPPPAPPAIRHLVLISPLIPEVRP